MYTPEINFLKERADLVQSTEGSITVGPISAGGIQGGAGAIGIGVVAAAIALGAFAYFQYSFTNTLRQLKTQQAQVTEELQTAEAELARLKLLETELNGVKAQTEGFKAFLGSLQPWSAILQDFRERIPENVWITAMTAVGNTVTIQGQSLSFEEVNDYLLTLLQSPFVENVLLTRGERQIGTDTTLPSVNYGLNVTVKGIGTSPADLVDSLEDRGSTGLVEKIKILRDLEETN